MLNANIHSLGSATLGAVLLLILAACGGAAAPTARPGGPTTPPGQPTPAPTSTPAVGPTNAPVTADACALLTVAEVSAAYGETLEGAVPSSIEAYAYCAYGAGDEVRTWVNTDPATATNIFNTMKINDGEAVAGVGDEAYWSTDSFQPGLYFMKGGVLAYISGSQSGPDDAIVQLGVLMASRM
ncbi:MAG: hypothetical protein QOJ81_1096 [Chloroflexota bacterium]|jgi:hypothetical protein|nr:hypothetical protein [Chloroflexota bacterium]